ncbi:MAG: Asp-tRNA(Asn)/Glu-tRNA(Gln) amidotransferase subunit GatA [Pseudomonadota bacterium]
MADLSKLTIATAREGLRKGDFSASELTETCLTAAEAAAPLNAYSVLTQDVARAQAAQADKRIADGDAPSMCGIPLGIKDLFCTKGVPSQAGSAILKDFTPEYESTVTTQLFDAGSVMIGKLNMDEFAMGSSNETSTYGPVTSPWRRAGSNTALTPGGSSGGSAAAVAADICLAATGTDTGGSIRQPAAFVGITGLKPTYGRVSRWGVIAFASSLDQAGPMTKDVRDAAIMLQAMAGHDPKDSTSADKPVPDFEAALTGDIRGKKIGIPKEYRLDGIPEEIDALWRNGTEMLRDAGAEIVDISLPHSKFALPAYYVIAPAEASSNLARYDGVRYGHRANLQQGEGIHDMYARTRAEGFGAEVQRRVMIGAYVLSAGFYDAYYNRARKVRTLIKQDFENVYADGIDAILTPATPTAAFGLGEMDDLDPVEMYLNDVFTVTVNMAGLPGISVPAGLDAQGLPLGLQLIGRPWEEGDLLNTAYALERSAGFVAKAEKWW